MDAFPPRDETQLFKRCFLSELAQETAAGWDLVQLVELDVIEKTTEVIPSPTPPTGSYQPTTLCLTKPLVVKTQVCLLRKSKDQRVREITGEIASLTTERLNALADAAQASKGLADAHKDLEKQVSILQARAEELGQLRGQLEQSRAANRKLETDLGKLRESIGKKAFDEVLAVK